MRIRPPLNFLAVLSLGLCSVLSSHAQTRYQSQPQGTSVKIDGTSTFHDWEMAGTIIGGFVEFGPDVKLDPAETTISGLKDGKIPVKIHAIIPVRSLHSKAEHLPDVMDHLMQEHLRADQFLRIEYSIKDMVFQGPHAPGAPFAVSTTGDLSIAGVTNTVSFPATIEALGPDKVKINAVVPLKMTAFNVDPPAPNIGAGAMRCGDDIKITIDWTLMERK